MISLNHDEYVISYSCNRTNIIIFKFHSKNNLKSPAATRGVLSSYIYLCARSVPPSTDAPACCMAAALRSNQFIQKRVVVHMHT